MVRNWPRSLHWTDFHAITTAGPHDLTALNGMPIVARVSLSIFFYPGASPQTQESGHWKFNTVDIAVTTQRLEYVPSRIPHGREAHYLRHEQGHMDLMGLFARELEVNLLALRNATQRGLLSEANTITDDAVASARMYAINRPGMDCMYDRETNHGMNSHGQSRWNSMIASNLARRNEANFIFRT